VLKKIVRPIHQTSAALALLKHRLDDTSSFEERSTALEQLARRFPDTPCIQIALAAWHYNSGRAYPALAALDHVAKLDALDAGMIGRRLALAMTLPDAGDTESRLKELLQRVPQTPRQRGAIASYLLVLYWLGGRLDDAYAVVQTHHSFTRLEDCDNDRPARVFFNYVLGLCVQWQENRALYQGDGQSLAVIGESHSLSPHHTSFNLAGSRYRAQSSFVMGCKMFHLGAQFPTVYQEAVAAHLARLESGTALMFAIGEIDCRPEEGIWPAAQKSGKDAIALADETVDRYLAYIARQTEMTNFSKVIIQGVPAPGYELTEQRDPGDKAGFLHMIRRVNERLKSGSHAQGWLFLDVYAATANENGQGNGRWHLDGWHLKPAFYQEAEKWCS